MASESDVTVQESPAGAEETHSEANGKRDLQKLLDRSLGIDVDEVLPEDVHRMIDDFEDQLEDMSQSAEVQTARTVLQRARLMVQMLGAWAEGSFSLPWRSATATAAGLTYLVNPGGILPEFLKGKQSLLNDALVVYLCYKLVEKDLKRFVEEQEMDPAEYGF